MTNNTALYIGIVILFLLVVTAIEVVRNKNLLTSTILLSIFSLLMAAQYLILGAPDVAITEAAVGCGISTILFLLTLLIVGDKEKKQTGNLFLPAIIIGTTASTLCYIAYKMPAFGDPQAPANQKLAAYFIEKAPQETGIPNMVTSILASYRGYDTLGETIVIVTAGIAVLLLIGKSLKKNKK